MDKIKMRWIKGKGWNENEMYGKKRVWNQLN